jgi:hypothetical protein
MKAKRITALIITLVFLVTSTGCVTTSHMSAPDLSLREDTKSILLMPMDIELSALTAGGMLEPNAAWTSEANKFVHAAISEKMSTECNAEIIDLDKEAENLDVEQRKLQTQLIKLHEAVGKTILVHKYLPPFKLPNKGESFDWTLGEEAKFLKEKFGTDYALFVYLRDSYATAGRVAVMIVAAVAVGVAVPMGQQVGFASLVDLNSGEVVWFNRLMREAGDLRNKEDAESSVDVLLVNFPT